MIDKPRSYQKDTLLVIEDEFVHAQTLREFAELWGIDVYVAVNSEEAWQIFFRNPVSAVMAEVRLPSPSGIEFLNFPRFDGHFSSI